MTVHWPQGHIAFQHDLAVLVAVTLGLAALALLSAARAVIGRWRTNRRARRDEVLEASWEQPVRDVLEGRRQVAAVHHIVRPRDALRFVDYLCVLARRLRDDERQPLVNLASPYLGRLVPRLTHRDEAIRIRAIQTLSLLAFDAYASHLAAALDDPSPVAAIIAARALARRRRPEHAALVVRRLQRFTQCHLSLIAAVVAEFGLDTVPVLLEAFADPGHPSPVRIVLADSLRMLQAAAAADVAAEIVVTAGDGELLVASLRLLKELGTHAHLGAARAQLASGAPGVRAEAIAAYGALAVPGDLPGLLPALADPSPWAALEAARALRRQGAVTLLQELAAGTDRRAAFAAEVLAESA